MDGTGSQTDRRHGLESRARFRPRPRSAAAGRPGFSLMEMLVILGVLSALSVLSLPKFYGLREYMHAYNAGRVLVSNLRETQDRAMTEGVALQVQFVNGSRTYATYQDGVLRGSYSLPVRLVFDGIDFGGALSVTYQTDGSPSSAGQLQILDEPSGRRLCIKVAAGTGRTTLLKEACP